MFHCVDIFKNPKTCCSRGWKLKLGDYAADKTFNLCCTAYAAFLYALRYSVVLGCITAVLNDRKKGDLAVCEHINGRLAAPLNELCD